MTIKRGYSIRRNRTRRIRAKLQELSRRVRDLSLDTLAIAFVILLALGSTLFAGAILISPKVLAGTITSTSDRIALATFFIELSALAAIGLAAFEFWRGHQGPKLRILLTTEERIQPREWIYVGEPTSHPSATFRLEMLLENAGPVAGRWIRVKVTATMLGGMQTARVVRLRPVGESSVGEWEQINDLGCAFLGNDSFVSYPRPREIHRQFLPMHGWADTIGRFELTCETRYETMPWDETSGLAQISTTVWADRSSRYDQQFTLLPGQEPDP